MPNINSGWNLKIFWTKFLFDLNIFTYSLFITTRINNPDQHLLQYPTISPYYHHSSFSYTHHYHTPLASFSSLVVWGHCKHAKDCPPSGMFQGLPLGWPFMTFTLSGLEIGTTPLCSVLDWPFLFWNVWECKPAYLSFHNQHKYRSIVNNTTIDDSTF
jgi:hypothetical protein